MLGHARPCSWDACLRHSLRRCSRLPFQLDSQWSIGMPMPTDLGMRCLPTLAPMMRSLHWKQLEAAVGSTMLTWLCRSTIVVGDRSWGLGAWQMFRQAAEFDHILESFVESSKTNLTSHDSHTHYCCIVCFISSHRFQLLVTSLHLYPFVSWAPHSFIILHRFQLFWSLGNTTLYFICSNMFHIVSHRLHIVST